MSGYTGENWIGGAKTRAVADVADTLGLQLLHRRYVCPVCNAIHKGRGTIDYSHTLWNCHHVGCDAKGDVLDLVAYALFSSPSKGLDQSGWAALRDWFGGGAAPVRSVPLVDPGPQYPSVDLVGAAWSECKPICNVYQEGHSSDVEAVQEWMWGRGIDPWVVAALDMVRVAPRTKDGLWHGWPWIAALPVYDATGVIRSFRQRAVIPCEKKSLAPTGYSAAGLVLACPMARGLLAGKRADIAGFPWSGKVWIMEGEPDFLKMACTIAAHLRGKEAGPALLGFIGSGGLPPEIAARIPKDATVYLVPHQDKNGAGQKAMSETEKRLRACEIKNVQTVNLKGV